MSKEAQQLIDSIEAFFDYLIERDLNLNPYELKAIHTELEILNPDELYVLFETIKRILHQKQQQILFRLTNNFSTRN